MLSDKEILEEIKKVNIVIDPYDIKNLGSNSYDVTLNPILKVYKSNGQQIMDIKNPSTLDTDEIKITDTGYTLLPNKLYLGITNEYTESIGLVPMLEGRSSIGRLGISVHQTAGFGDAGFKGQWTLEITTIHPIRIYANMKFAQICWFRTGEVLKPYYAKKDPKYVTTRNSKPMESKIYEDFSK